MSRRPRRDRSRAADATSPNGRILLLAGQAIRARPHDGVDLDPRERDLPRGRTAPSCCPSRTSARRSPGWCRARARGGVPAATARLRGDATLGGVSVAAAGVVVAVAELGRRLGLVRVCSCSYRSWCRSASCSWSARPACSSTSAALKELYARVVAGFALGFVAGGLAGPVLLARARRDREPAGRRGRGRRGVPRSSWSRRRRRYPAELSVDRTRDVDASARRCARWRATATSCSSSRSRCCPRWRASGSTSSCSSAPRSATTTAASSLGSSASSRPSPTGPTSCSSSSSPGCCSAASGCATELTANAVGVLTVVGAIIVAAVHLGLGRDDRVRAHRGRAGHRPDVQRRHVADVVERGVPGGADPAASGGPSHGRGARGAAGHRRERRGAARRRGGRAAPTG